MTTVSFGERLNASGWKEIQEAEKALTAAALLFGIDSEVGKRVVSIVESVRTVRKEHEK